MFKISKPLHLSAMSLVSIMLIPIVCSCQSDIMSSKDVTEGAPKSAVAPYYYLPKADVTIAITDAAIGDKATTFQIAIKSTRYLPDPKHMYRIDVDENAFSDDEVDVQTSTDGLLTSVKGKSKDQTGAVLAKLAELAKEAAKFTAFAGAELFSAELDPTSKEDRDRINKLLGMLIYQKANPRLSIAIRNPPDDLLAKDADRCTTGICFRPAVPYTIDLVQTSKDTKNNADVENILGSVEALVPNGAKIGSIAVDRADFVEKETTLTFVSGMLTGVNMKKPSEALAAVQVPLDITKTIVSIPSDLLTFRTQKITDQQGLLEAQTKYLQAQAELLKAQQDLMKASGSGVGSGAGSGAVPPAIPPPVQ